MPGLYTPGENRVDTIFDELNAADGLDCGILDNDRDSVVEALNRVRSQIWKNSDSYNQQTSAPYLTRLRDRSDVAANLARNDPRYENVSLEDAVAAIKSSPTFSQLTDPGAVAARKTLEEAEDSIKNAIRGDSDLSLVRDAISALQDFAQAIERQRSLTTLPTALTSFDAAEYARRVDIERDLKARGAQATLAAYKAVLKNGTPQMVETFEQAAETFMLEIARGGTAPITRSARAEDRASGNADAEWGASTQFLALLKSNRDNRKPEWLANAEVAYAMLAGVTQTICGETPNFLTNASKGIVLSVFKVDPGYGSRWLPDGPPGWSRIVSRGPGRAVTREPANPFAPRA